MKTLNTQVLSNVAGGKKDDSVLTAVNELQTSIKDIASSKTNQQDPSMFMMMAMMMSQRSAPTVVAAAPAASPVINVSTRVRRW
ncbi:MAG: hypothetical protein WKG01_12715 [Kofleriaceae bacterium]